MRTRRLVVAVACGCGSASAFAPTAIRPNFTVLSTGHVTNSIVPNRSPKPLGLADSSRTSFSSSESDSQQEQSHDTLATTTTTTDPLQYQYDQLVSNVNREGLVNFSFLLMVALVVLFKFTTINSHMLRGWTAEEIALRIPVENWLSYSAILDAAPVQTKAVTSATVYTIGDLIAQRTEGKTMGELDRMRTIRSMLAGLLAHGPMSHYWYEWSESLFENVFHWTQWWSFFPKVMVDQMFWGPFWNNTYIVLLGLMKRDAWQTTWADVKRTTIPLVVSGLKLWPLAHCVTYGLVPVENRLLWVDLVEILWVTILATQAAGGGAEEEAVGVVQVNDGGEAVSLMGSNSDPPETDEAESEKTSS